MINSKSEIRNPKQIQNSKLKIRIIFFIIILFSIFYFLNSIPVRAEVPVKCEKCSTESTLKDFSKTETKNTQNIYSEQLKEFNQKLSNADEKNVLTNQLNNQIMQWVQGKSGSGNCTISGINGPIVVPCNQQNQPKFVTNWEQYLNQAAQQGSNRFLTDFEGSKACTSAGGVDTTAVLKKDLQKALTSSYAQDTSCDITNNSNIFQPGGSSWTGWLQLNELGNDPYSWQMLAYDESANNAEAVKNAKQSEVMASQGFIGEKTCNNETTKTVYNPDGTSVTSFVCLDEQIKTPGSVVAALNQRASTSQFDVIANSESLNNYISTLASSIFSLISGLGFSNIPAGAVGSGSSTPLSTSGTQTSSQQACAPLLQTGTATASVVLIDGFDNSAAGPLNGKNGWTAGTQGNDLIIDNTFAHDGANSLRITGGNYQTGSTNITPITSSDFTVSFWNYWTSSSSTIANPAIIFGQTNNADAISFSAQGGQYKLGNNLLFGNLVLNSWHFLEIEINLSNQQARSRVDSGAWTGWVGFSSARVTQIASLKVSSGGAGQTFLDTVSYSLPAPPTGTANPANSTVYQNCVSAVQSGQDPFAFGKQYLSNSIGNELGFLTQILQAKQNTANLLAQSIDTLNQTKSCQTSIGQSSNASLYFNANPGAQTVFVVPATLQNDIQARNTVAQQIITLQNRINTLNSLQTSVQGLTDPGAISNAVSSYTPSLGPGEGQSNLDNATQEMTQAQQNLTTDQGKLLSCQNQLSAVQSYTPPTQ